MQKEELASKIEASSEKKEQETKMKHCACSKKCNCGEKCGCFKKRAIVWIINELPRGKPARYQSKILS